MRRLTISEVETFSAREGVDSFTVENFLMTCHYAGDAHAAYDNARADARACGWDDGTLTAVIDGIALASTGGRQ